MIMVEPPPTNSAGTWGGDCNPDGSITLALNDNKTCTITNNDITATLKVVKTITNDNGGTITNRNAFGSLENGNRNNPTLD